MRGKKLRFSRGAAAEPGAAKVKAESFLNKAVMGGSGKVFKNQ